MNLSKEPAGITFQNLMSAENFYGKIIVRVSRSVLSILQFAGLRHVFTFEVQKAQI
jgi:hypothetical protein